MDDPLQNCIDKLNLEDPDRIKAKAQELLTKVSRLPTKLFKGPQTTYVVSLQLAHESLKYPGWKTESAAQLAGCSVSVYEGIMSAVRKHLNMQPNVTLDALMVALGSSMMKPLVTELWEDFIQAYLGQFSGVQQKNMMRIEVDKTPCWKGATVYCCAQATKHNLKKDKIKELCACSMPELNKSIKEIQTKCKGKLEELRKRMANNSSSIEKKARKRAIKEDDATSDDDDDDIAKNNPDQSKLRNTRKRQKLESNAGATSTAAKDVSKRKIKAISGIASMIDYIDYTTTKQFKDYLIWRETTLERLRK